MNTQYIIINMHGITHSIYGDVVMVKANPVSLINRFVSYSPHEIYETVTFIVSEEMATGWIINIARAKELWTPNMLNYAKGEIYDEDSGKDMDVYIEKSIIRKHSSHF